MDNNQPTVVNDKKGKGLVFDGKSQFIQFQVKGFPFGNSARTIEFWVRAKSNTDGKQHYIFSAGKKEGTGSTFGVCARYRNSQNYLDFWSHDNDIDSIATFPDDQWHFVALSYDGSTLRFFLNGELKLAKKLSLDTKPGPVFIGNRDGFEDFFEGAVRDIAIWDHARNQKQIQMDMVPWPRLSENENGLVAYLPLNEGKGNTFSDIKNAINGTIDNKATWSRPIAVNPDPINEGIWFVIQNKADLDTDTEMTVRRKALFVSGERIHWGAIPPTGDYDAFLWRTVLRNGKYRLINKKLGMTKALNSYSGKRYTYMADYGVYKGQEWIIQQTDPDNWGTNVYTLSNIYVSTDEALSLEGNEVRFVAKKEGRPNQAWVMQPMELAIGYHIPVSDPANSPMRQELEMAYGFKVYASNTVREWSVLNGHLIWKNMLNALYDSAIKRLESSAYTRREVQIISRFDQNSIVAQYPLNMANGQIIWNEHWFTKYRGGSGNDTDRSLSSTTASEEMMCRRGTFSAGYHERSYREFDQVVHEFAHALDYTCGMESDSFPLPHPFGSKKEVIAAAIQAWFNNNAYDGFARTRIQQKTGQPEHYKRLAECFRESNSWMPPRWLRDQPDGRVELKDGETLQMGEWIYSTPPYGPNGSYAVLQGDGNFIVCTNDGNILKWGSHNTLRVPLNKASTLKMENGILHMKDASGNSVYSSSNAASPGARLVIAEPLPDKPDSWIRIMDSEGRLVWNS